jgi:hypothetical protein
MMCRGRPPAMKPTKTMNCPGAMGCDRDSLGLQQVKRESGRRPTGNPAARKISQAASGGDGVGPAAAASGRPREAAGGNRGRPSRQPPAGGADEVRRLPVLHDEVDATISHPSRMAAMRMMRAWSFWASMRRHPPPNHTEVATALERKMTNCSLKRAWTPCGTYPAGSRRSGSSLPEISTAAVSLAVRAMAAARLGVAIAVVVMAAEASPADRLPNAVSPGTTPSMDLACTCGQRSTHSGNHHNRQGFSGGCRSPIRAAASSFHGLLSSHARLATTWAKPAKSLPYFNEIVRANGLRICSMTHCSTTSLPRATSRSMISR